MSGTMILVAEVGDGAGGTLYFSTHAYFTKSTDTPASTGFLPRITDDVDFDRRVGCSVWGSASRGTQSFGVLRIANADGAFDAYVGTSLRDEPIVLKRGYQHEAYSTFQVAATLIVDRLDTTDELVMSIIMTDLTAKLEVSAQTSLYPATVADQSLRYKPRPKSFGRTYQAPLVRPDPYGNGRYDLHDTEQWIGVEQVMDRGATLIEGNGYRRSIQSGIYGIERLTAVLGKQCATVLGAFRIESTQITEDFANLTSWTETNGGAAGRDVSIVSNAARILNTAGGSDLSIAWNASTPTGTAATYWFYEFTCTARTSGYAQLRTETTCVQRKIDAAGRYTGIIRASGNVVPSFVAPNGSNCDLTIDSFRLRKVEPMTGLEDCITYLATNDTSVGGGGPLTTADLDLTAIAGLESDAPYELGWRLLDDPVQIADMLDQTMASFTGWWFVDADGLITVGRLEAPSGTPVLSFDQDSITAGMSIVLDEAKGLSNRGLGKRNWTAYADGEMAESLGYVTLNAMDADADVTLSGGAYTYSAANVGSVRSSPLIFGDRYYLEVKITAVGGSQHLVGVGSAAATITNYPGATADSIAFRSNGNSYVNGSSAAYGSAYIANDYVGIALDGRAAAMGSRSLGFLGYFSVNGTWQNASDPETDTAPLVAALNSVGIAFGMFGGNAAATNSGTVNFGNAAFQYAPPADYVTPASHGRVISKAFRDEYQSSVTLADAYAFANASEAAPITYTSDASADVAYLGGIPTFLTKRADLEAETDRWCNLYTVERFFYTFDVLLPAATTADILSPGALISVSYPRNGLSSKLLRVVGVKGRLLDQRVTLTCWG